MTEQIVSRPNPTKAPRPLRRLRSQIDIIDRQIIGALAQRIRFGDTDNRDQVEKIPPNGKYGLSRQLLVDVYNAVHDETPDTVSPSQEVTAAMKKIFDLMRRRMRYVERVGAYKRTVHAAPLDATRWQQVLDSRREIGANHGLSDAFIVNIFHAIHEEALRIESRKKWKRRK